VGSSYERQTDEQPRRTPCYPDIALGGTFPEYELADHTKVPSRLSAVQGDDPLILTLASGISTSTSNR